MRSGVTRSNISAAAGHWTFAYLEVTDDSGAWGNLGALTVAGQTLNFFNRASVAEDVDSNTFSFSATLKREIGATYSLSPLRTDSPVNVSAVTPGTYSPRTDLHRLWRIMVWVGPRGTTPVVPTDYRELAAGVVDKIDIDGLAGTITLEGRGMEADILDAFVVDDRTYSGDQEVVIQQALDDQLGVSVVTLSVPGGPTSFHVDDVIGDINLMPAISDIAALNGNTLRYRYDASDVNQFTLFTPPRTASVADWTIESTEYEDLAAELDLSGMRNYIKVRYADPANGLVTVVSPGAESGTVSCTSGAATFSVSQAGVLADGAMIVVDDVGYRVTAFNGTTGCTLAAAPDFTSKQFYTSASITKYGLETFVLDFAATSQITTLAAAQNLADAVRSDREDPALVQSFKAPGLWFAQLHDYVCTVANGKHYNEDQYGGVTSISHEFADGDLTTTIGLAGKPRGRYTTWKQMGSGAGAAAVLPVIDYFAPSFFENTGSGFGGFIWGAGYGDYCLSIRVEYGTDASFAVATVVDYDKATDNPILDGFNLTGVSDRSKTYYFRATPYTGPVVAGDPTGYAGTPVTKDVYVPPLLVGSSSLSVDFSVPGQITADVIAGGGGGVAPDSVDYLVKTASADLSAERVVTDTTTVAWDWATAGQAKASVPNASLGLAKLSATGTPSSTTYLRGDNTWATPSGGSGASEVTTTLTTASLANGATETGTITVAKTALLQKVVASAACWMRLYVTSAARTSDASRAITSSPYAGTGILSNVAPGLNSAGLTVPITPAHELHNGDSPRTTTIYYSVTNKSGSTAAITLTLTSLAIET